MNFRTGQISSNDVALSCLDGSLDLFQGSNRHYDAYFEAGGYFQASLLVEYWRAARKVLSSRGSRSLRLVVPNKATCRKDLYPLYLPEQGSPLARYLRSLRDSDITETVLPPGRLAESLSANEFWLPPDSHWSPRGAKTVSDIVLSSFEIGIRRAVVHEDFHFYGDLNVHFGVQNRCSTPQQPKLIEAPSIVSQGPTDHKTHQGKWSIIRNLLVDQHSLLVIGSSFSGAGDSPSGLTYWLSQGFRTTTFLWSGFVPQDLDYSKFTHFVHESPERFVARHNPPPFEFRFGCVELNDKLSEFSSD